MAMFSGLPPVREDFRCSVCRQKNAFHCEHDTPYRDQLLGTYDHSNPRGSHKKTTSTSNKRRQTTNNDRHGQSNAAARYEQHRRGDNGSLTNTNEHGSLRTHEHKKKKNKSCVIL